MPSYRFATPPGHRPLLARSARLGVLTPMLWLLGCASTVPLPSWTPVILRPASAAPTPVPAPALSSAPPAAVQVSPVLPPATASEPAQAPALYSEALAARFSAPAVTYSTPGLQAGRTSFTSQSELQHWLQDQAEALSRSVGVKAAVLPIGQSQQGQALEALVLTRGAGTDAAALRATGRPTVLLIAQQHGDEPAGSEALLVVARELAQGLLQPLLEQINVVIVPRANPDGAASDQAATANGVDLARDHLLLSTPEAQALAKLASDYQPTVVLDAQEYAVPGNYLQKFGALPKFDAQLAYASTANLPEFLTKAAEEWYRRPMLAALKGQSLTSEWAHSTSAEPADRKVAMGSARPEMGPNAQGLKNIISLVVQSRGAGLGRLDLQRRVHTHVTAIASVLGSTAQRAKELGQLRPYIDKEVSALACKGQAIVEAAPTPAQHDLVMLDPASGADKSVSVDWDSSLALRSLKQRVRPCGYWLSASATTAVERLRLQGLQVQRVLAQSALLGDMYRDSASVNDAKPEARAKNDNAASPPASTVALVRGVIDAPAGSYYISLKQPLANLAIAALEPDTPSSYLSNQLISGLSNIARVMTEPSVQTEALP